MTATVPAGAVGTGRPPPDLVPAAGPPVPVDVLAEEIASYDAVGAALRPDTTAIEEELAAAAGPATSVPSRLGDWWYVLRRAAGGRPGSSLHRFPVTDPHSWNPPEPPGPAEEQLVHDPAAPPGSPGRPTRLGTRVVGPDGRHLAFTVDPHGDERFDVIVRELPTDPCDAIDPDRDRQLASGTGPAVVFAPGGRAVHCIDVDDTRRPWRVVRIALPGKADGATGPITADDDQRPDVVVAEPDPRSTVRAHHTRSGQFVLVTVQTPTGTEIIAVEGPDGPRRDVLVPRAAQRQMTIDHVRRADGSTEFVVLERGRATGDRVSRVPGDVLGDFLGVLDLPAHGGSAVGADRNVGRPDLGRPVGAAPGRQILGVLPFAGFDVVTTADPDGSITHRFRRPDGQLTHATDGAMILSGNDDPDAPTARFVAVDHLRPPRSLEIDPHGGTVERSSGAHPATPVVDATVETLTARSADGTDVAVTVLRPTGQRSPGPAVLIGYGAYGVALRPLFDPTRVPFLSRGIPVALAHVRGGGEGGPAWHAAGTGPGKIAAVHDFLACADTLVDHGIAAAGRILATGGSAGGTLVAAALNERPTAFAGAVLDLPFVDPLGTMSDPDLPFTVRDRREWGDPIADPEARAVLQAYSPLQNVRAQAYPPVWCTAAVHDVRVPLAGPVRWAREIRRLGTGAAPVVLDIRRDDGHAASTATTPGTAVRLAWALAVLDGRIPSPAPDPVEVPT